MASNEIEILDSAASVGKLKKTAAGRALDRRHFLAALGMTSAAAGAALVGCSTTSSPVAVTSAGSGQTNVLNFILNIKYLQATFYAYITTGADLSSGTANSGAITGAPAKLTFTGANASQITDMLNEIYFDEKNHVTILLNLLGASAIARPAINLAAFAPITATNALSIARLLEDVGVTAIAGAAAGLTTSNLTFTSQIIGVDSFHAGSLRLVSLQNPTIAAYIKADSLDVAPFDPGSNTTAAAGPTGNGAFFATAGSASNPLAVPAGFAFARNPSGAFGALAVVYGAPGAPAGSGTSSGGFFPSGVNGVIKTV
jgi:Ferritin-like domain